MSTTMPTVAAAKVASAKKKLEEYKERRKNSAKKNVQGEINLLEEVKSKLEKAAGIDPIILNTESASSFFDEFPNKYNGHKSENISRSESIESPYSNNDNKPAHQENEQLDGDDIEETLSGPAAIKLQQRLQFHMQTVEFLVSEKNVLSSKINELEKITSDLKSENDDLSGRLNISRQRASSLEIEYSTLKEKHEHVNDKLNSSLAENSKYKTAESSHIKLCDELKEQLAESKSVLNVKLAENAELLKKVEDLTFHINANELRYRQLNQGFTENSNQSIEENAQLNKKIAHLTQELIQLETEKNQSNAQYQQYVQQLNDQLEILKKKHEDLLLANENLQNRESTLLQQMESLEKQLQTTIHNATNVSTVKEVSNLELNSQLEEKIQLTEDINLQIKNELQQKEVSLQAAMNEITRNKEQIEELTGTLNAIRAEQPNIAKLHAANESDKIAAQKATAQNSKLKKEIENLQEAYNKMTESKLDLAELLQAEKNHTKTLTLTLADNEEKLKMTQSQLSAKDEEMLRLQAESNVLEKEAFKNAQIIDRFHHYQVQNQSYDLIQKELELARARLKSVMEENEKLKTVLSENSLLPTNNDESIEKSIIEDSNMVNDNENETSNLLNHNDDKVIIEKYSNDSESHHHDGSDDLSVKKMHSESCFHIPTNEAMRKLQERFTKLMDDVANLSDDKQRLEHLVLQLQGETETICEYIALYQKQRSVLKQREYEKDIQLRSLSLERQEMKERLDALGSLVQQLLVESKISNNKMTNVPNGTVLTEKSEIVDKILQLLSDIKNVHLTEENNTFNYSDNFHPCPWCSGKMLHV